MKVLYALTITHTAFARGESPAQPSETVLKVDTNQQDHAALRELAFEITNAPYDMLPDDKRATYDAAERTGRTYSTSVGDLVMVQGSDGSQTLAAVMPIGFKVLAEGVAAIKARYKIKRHIRTHQLDSWDVEEYLTQYDHLAV